MRTVKTTTMPDPSEERKKNIPRTMCGGASTEVIPRVREDNETWTFGKTSTFRLKGEK